MWLVSVNYQLTAYNTNQAYETPQKVFHEREIIGW